jgi:hypothetical protein
MSRNTKIVLALVVLGAAAVLAIGLWANARRAKQTATAVAMVVDVTTASRKGQDDTIVTLSYQAGSAAAQGRARVRGVHVQDYPRGRRLPICYDPADTHSLRIAQGPCG